MYIVLLEVPTKCYKVPVNMYLDQMSVTHLKKMSVTVALPIKLESNMHVLKKESPKIQLLFYLGDFFYK